MEDISTPGITVRLAKIDKQGATDLLDRNKSNRKVKRNGLKRIEAALLAGEWRLNGSSILVADTGKLLDGQHRLLAVESTGVPIVTLLVEGVSEDVQSTIDIGVSRTARDNIGMKGISNATNLSTLARFTLRREVHGRTIEQALTDEDTQSALTVPMILEYVEENEEYLRSIMSGGAPLRKIGVTTRLSAVTYYLLSRVDEDFAKEFIDRLGNGTDLSEGDPILTLRETFIRRLMMSKLRGDKLSSVEVIAFTAKAWNRWVTGREAPRIYSFRSSESIPEILPPDLERMGL